MKQVLSQVLIMELMEAMSHLTQNNKL